MCIKINICLLLSIAVFFSCSEEGSDNNPISEPVRTDTPITKVSTITTEEEPEQNGFRPDFSIVTGVHKTGEEAHQSLDVSKFRISKWSSEALLNPDFPMSGKRETFHVVILSLLEMGFLENELVSLETVLEKVEKMDLVPLTPEQAIATREQFIAQPDYTTGERLGEFFIAMEPMNLFADGLRKIFSIHRDDEFPHPDTNVGLWLISNNIEDVNGPRLFDPLDPEGVDLGGRFACIVPPELNLDSIDLEENNQE